MLNRRAALALLGSGAATHALTSAFAADRGGDGTFLHGVASGDPTADGAVIWTRVTPNAKAQPDMVALKWAIMRRGSRRGIRFGRIEARAQRDYTAKVPVDGLDPGTEYEYWFETVKKTRSDTGRFRTLETGALERLTLAVASCQLYQGGFFNAMAGIAAEDRLDAIIHLGDYIYEYGADYPVPGGPVTSRVPDPPHELLVLADYRARHAQCKLDPDLQAAHARAAFICVWDDHEVADNSWVDGAANHQVGGESDWRTRKAAALRAWFEWMPIRDPVDPTAPEAIYRSFRFGNLATLFMLESRLFSRSRPPAKWQQVAAMSDLDGALDEIRAPEREMLGGRQQTWLRDGLSASVRAGQPWQIIGSQVLMAKVQGPDLEKRLGAEGYAKLLAGIAPALRKAIKNRVRSFQAGIPFNPDAWDGYPAARERLYTAFRFSGAMPLIVSGDSHAFWANNLVAADGTIVARELGTTAISSPGYGDALPGMGLGMLLAAENDDVISSDQAAKGYLLVDLTRDELRASFMAVSTVKQRGSDVTNIGAFKASPRGLLEHAD